VPGFTFWLVVIVAQYFFLFPVYNNLKLLNGKGYELNNILLVIETVTMAVQAALKNGDLLFGLVLGIPMGILFWWLPNHVYFKHRKYLFTGTKTLNELIEEYKKEEQKPNAESIAEPDTKEKPIQQTPVLRSLPQEEKGAPSEDAQQIKYCRICGKQLPAGSKFCTECGTEVAAVSPSRFEKLRRKATGQKNIRTIPVNKAEDQPRKIEFPREKMNATVRRGFLFLEDEEWENADRYFERVLDEEPENAYAHLGKLMVEQKLANVEQLKEYAETVNESKHFKRVLRFADEDLGAFLRTLQEPDDESDTDDSVEASIPAATPLIDEQLDQEKMIGQEEARMRELYPDDFSLLVRFWAVLFYIKTKQKENNLPDGQVSQFLDGVWNIVENRYGQAMVKKIKCFLSDVDENKLASELNVMERIENGDEAFTMPWAYDDNRPTVFIDISE